MSRVYIAKHRGHTESVCEQDGKWRVNPVRMPDGSFQELMTGDRLIDGTAVFEKLFDSLEEAKSAAHKQLQTIVGEAFGVEWTDKC